MNAQPAGEHDDATEVSADPARAFVFKNRGTLLAIPALMFVAFGKPSRRSIAAGLPLAVAGELLRCWAVGYTGVTTRGDRVTAPALVTAGPYAHVRNPLYLGNLITGTRFRDRVHRRAPAATAQPDDRARHSARWLAVYAAIVPHEEQFLRGTFGDDYRRLRGRASPRWAGASSRRCSAAGATIRASSRRPRRERS